MTLFQGLKFSFGIHDSFLWRRSNKLFKWTGELGTKPSSLGLTWYEKWLGRERQGSKRKDLRKCKWGRSCQIILEFLKESSVLLSKGAQGPSSFLGLPIQWIPKGWNQQLLHRSSSILLEQMAFFLLVPFFSWMDGGKRDKSNQEHLLLSLLWFIKKEESVKSKPQTWFLPSIRHFSTKWRKLSFWSKRPKTGGGACGGGRSFFLLYCCSCWRKTHGLQNFDSCWRAAAFTIPPFLSAPPPIEVRN